MTVRRALAAAAVVLSAAALLLSFELGRSRAGFSLFDQRLERETFRSELAARDARIDTLEREIAILRTSSQIDGESNAAVRANLAELEARLQTQEEELAFYRGIVSPADGVAGLRIQSIEIEPDPGGAAIELRVLLVQAIVNNDPVSGELRANLRGSQDGQTAAYTLEDLGAGPEAIRFEFRYFQALALELVLPAGFEPLELEIEVWPQSPQGETIVQNLPWDSLER